MDFEQELVTIVVPTYNRKERLLTCIRSILNQSYRPLEIIIVNDGDVDVKKMFEDNQIFTKDDVTFEVLKNQRNFGACISRNIGIEEAKGKFLTLCDDDDEFTENRIYDLVKKIKESEFNIVFSDTINRFENTKEVVTNFPAKVSEEQILNVNCIGAQVLSYSSFFKEVKFDRKFVASQDHDFNYRLVKKYGKAIKCDKPTYISNQYASGNRVSNGALVGNLQFYMKHKGDFFLKMRLMFFLKFAFKLFINVR